MEENAPLVIGGPRSVHNPDPEAMARGHIPIGIKPSMGNVEDVDPAPHDRPIRVPIEVEVSGRCPVPGCTRSGRGIATTMEDDVPREVGARRLPNGRYQTFYAPADLRCPACRRLADLTEGPIAWRPASRGVSTGAIVAKALALRETGGPLDLVRSAALMEMSDQFDPGGWASLAELRSHRAYSHAMGEVEGLPIDSRPGDKFPIGEVRFNAAPPGLTPGIEIPSPSQYWQAIEANLASASPGALESGLIAGRLVFARRPDGRELVVEVATITGPPGAPVTFCVGRLSPPPPTLMHAPDQSMRPLAGAVAR